MVRSSVDFSISVALKTRPLFVLTKPIKVVPSTPWIDESTATVAERVFRAFVDGERHDVLALGRVEGRVRRQHLEVGIAVRQVEAAQQLLVGLQLLFAVDVLLVQPAQPVGLAGLDDARQVRARIGLIADENDRANARPVALGDHEDDVDAVVSELVDLRLDGGAAASAARVVFLDAIDVALQPGVGQHAARLRPRRPAPGRWP